MVRARLSQHAAGYDRHEGHSVAMFRDKFCVCPATRPGESPSCWWLAAWSIIRPMGLRYSPLVFGNRQAVGHRPESVTAPRPPGLVLSLPSFGPTNETRRFAQRILHGARPEGASVVS